VTEAGGGNIYRLSATGGYGDLDEDGLNIMATVSKSYSKALNGSERSFVNGNQPIAACRSIRVERPLLQLSQQVQMRCLRQPVRS
jgi:hypothetical protein